MQGHPFTPSMTVLYNSKNTGYSLPFDRYLIPRVRDSELSPSIDLLQVKHGTAISTLWIAGVFQQLVCPQLQGRKHLCYLCSK